MFLQKVLNQPNLVGTVLIALMVCGGIVYTFASDGFNVKTVTGGEVEAWLAAAGGGNSGGPSKCDCLGPDGPCGCIPSSSYSCSVRTCPSHNSLCSVESTVCLMTCKLKCSTDISSNGSGWCAGNCDKQETATNHSSL